MRLKQIFCKHKWIYSKDNYRRYCQKCMTGQYRYTHLSLFNPISWWDIYDDKEEENKILLEMLGKKKYNKMFNSLCKDKKTSGGDKMSNKKSKNPYAYVGMTDKEYKKNEKIGKATRKKLKKQGTTVW